MLIKEIMKKPYVIDKDISLKKAAELMKKHDINSLIVVKKEKIIGIITHEDLVENFSGNKKVSSVMSKNVIAINENEKTENALEMMRKNKISFLPVLDDKMHLVGILHVKDLMNETDVNDFLMN